MRSHFHTLALVTLAAALPAGCLAVNDQSTVDIERARAMHPLDAQVTVAAGQYELHVDGEGEDDASAALIAARGEAMLHPGVGAGLLLEFISSNDHLQSAQAATPSHAESFDVAPFVAYHAYAGDRFRMPVQIGPWFQLQTVDDQESTNRMQWTTLGFRLAAEPEFVIEQSQDFEWSLFSSISVAGGLSRVEVDTTTGNEDFDTRATSVGFEVGPRIRWSKLVATLSYLHRAGSFDESDTNNNVFVEDVHTAFNGLAFTLGAGF